ncbi:MAG TPA: ATP-binding protein, partial [Flavisolibacter sp.]|nr:ATP-binding protein [Flavisolibacter sp.]
VLKMTTIKLTQEHPDISLTMEAEELPIIPGDAEQLRFLFAEIFSNAVRFRKDGNKVGIAVTASRLLRNQFKTVPGRYKYVDYLKLDITDNGLGISSQYKDQALELFKRLHPASGRGVGLSLCKKIVENHGGSMVLESKEGQGTTITIWLPLLKEQPAVPVTAVENSQKIEC